MLAVLQRRMYQIKHCIPLLLEVECHFHKLHAHVCADCIIAECLRVLQAGLRYIAFDKKKYHKQKGR